MNWLKRAFTLPKDRNAITDVFNLNGYLSHVVGGTLLQGVAAIAAGAPPKAVGAAVLTSLAVGSKTYFKIPLVIKL
jgi:hypothetical protein